jgi:Family of unknown function (DUF6065)
LPTAKIEQLKIKRDWMNSAVYNCTPLVMGSLFGYGVYFEEDISFVWDGDVRHPSKVLKGENFVGPDRGAGSVSFHTNLVFKTNENTSLLTMPVPNQPIKDATVLTTILSSSFFTQLLPIVWQLDLPNKEYFVPAGTYVGCIIPISISQFQNSVLKIHQNPLNSINFDNDEYIAALKKGQKEGKFLRFYQKGIDHKGNVIGKHELKYLKLNVEYESDNNDL